MAAKSGIKIKVKKKGEVSIVEIDGAMLRHVDVSVESSPNDSASPDPRLARP